MSASFESSPYEVADEANVPHWNAYSVALHIFLPVAGLAILFGQQGLFAKLLLHLDRSCISVLCPSISRREKLLKWAGSRLPMSWSSHSRTLSGGLVDMWKDGSLLCTLINSAIIGACPNPHRHWKKPPSHAQALAYKYLGVTPVFTEEEFNGKFTIAQEKEFIDYLNALQQAVNRLSQKDDQELKFSDRYVARGMGLFTGEQHKRTIFYIYSCTNTKNTEDVLIHIRGPYGTYGKTVVPPFSSLKMNNTINSQPNRGRQSFLKRMSKDFTSLISCNRRTSVNDNIQVSVEMELERAKITYIPKNDGMYEINLICDGEVLRGSPYSVHVIQNSDEEEELNNNNVVEKECVEKRYQKKVISKIIDFIDDKFIVSPRRFSRTFALEYFAKNLNESSANLTVDQQVEDSYNNSNNESSTNEEYNNNHCFTNTNNKAENEISGILHKMPCKKISEEDEECSVVDLIDNVDKKSHSLNLEKTDIVPKINTVNNIHNSLNNVTKNKIQEENFEMDFNRFLFVKEKFNTVSNESTKEFKNILNSYSKVDSNKIQEIATCKKNEYQRNSICKNDLNKKFKGFETHSVKYNVDQNCKPFEMHNRPESNNVKPSKVEKTQEPLGNPLPPNSLVTSPICLDHIAPEVEKKSASDRKLSLTEKRQRFSRQSTISISDSMNSSFSENENDEGSVIHINNNYATDKLSVLNVISSLKQSGKESENLTVSGAISMPNISSCNYLNNSRPWTSDDSNVSHFAGLVKQRKEYWDRLSSQSSSTVSLPNSVSCLGRKTFKINKIPQNTKSSFKRNSVTKSADDILCLRSEESSLNKAFSLGSRSEYSLMSIEERKKRLLKENYAREDLRNPATRRTWKLFRRKSDVTVKERPERLLLRTISRTTAEKIRIFEKEHPAVESGTTSFRPLPKTKIASPLNANPLLSKKVNRVQQEQSKDHKESFKSQFKRAVKYFKNLEQNTKTKIKVVSNPSEEQVRKPLRKYSLSDVQPKKSSEQKPGGSLQLPSTNDRFAVSNLYEDVLGNKGSFRGTPNKTAVANALASLNGNNSKNINMGYTNEDEIKFQMFLNKSKSRVRKSIKSFFDVNY